MHFLTQNQEQPIDNLGGLLDTSGGCVRTLDGV
jgi:hypothetical protein